MKKMLRFFLLLLVVFGVAAGVGRESTAVLSTLLALVVLSLMPKVVRLFEKER